VGIDAEAIDQLETCPILDPRKAVQARSESIGVWGRGWTIGPVLVQADPTLRDDSSAPFRRIVHFTSPISEKGGEYRSSHVICMLYRRLAGIADYCGALCANRRRQDISYIRLTYNIRAYTAPPLGPLRDEVDIVKEIKSSLLTSTSGRLVICGSLRDPG
jgi:hypothetical protein